MRGFVYELRRRNVLRVAAAYALIAWIIIEAGSVLLPTFGADEGTFQLYVIVVLAGFVVALVCSWVFEITPDGVKLDKDVARDPVSSSRPKRTMNFALVGLLVVALVVSITFNISDLRTSGADSAEGKMLMRRSIAVLPFTSRSSDPDNVFFADGIHDDLLTKLARIGSFRVISRTSVLEYRETAKNLRQIGKELGVDTILEGSVQKSGDDVRINVQLIDAATDEHLWAQIYDRSLADQSIFAAQSEISTEISGALQSTLMPDDLQGIPEIPTENLRAYSLYVSGRDNIYLRRLETLLEARQQFSEAIELDPEYAEAHVGLAESILLLSNNHQVLPLDDAVVQVQGHLDTALALNPELADAYAALGLLKANVWEQTRVGTENLEAEAAFEQAIGLNPNSAQAYMWFATLRSAEQRFEDAIGLYHRSIQLDPLGRIPYSNLPTLYAQLGQNETALKLLLEAMEIHPEWPTPYQYLAQQLAGLGRLDEALAWNKIAQNLSTDATFGGDILAGSIYLQFGDNERARENFTSFSEDHPLAPLTDGFLLLLDGQFNDALVFFSDFIDENPGAAVYILGLASDVALLAGDIDRSEEFLLRREPLLQTDAIQQIDRLNVRNVVRLAFIYQQRGDHQKATDLLNGALAVVRTMPRLGMFGYGIRDAQIFALLGRKEEAFNALREAVDLGFRSSIVSDGWPLPIDPLLVSLQDDPRFSALLNELDSLNAEMHEQVLLAEETDNWQPLSDRVRAN